MNNWIKSFSLPLALVMSTNTAQAEVCSDLGALAEIIMKVRQDGVALSTLMPAITSSIEDTDDNQIVIKIAKTAVLAAYEIPRYSSSDIRNDTIADFRNKMELECYKMLLSD